jgi:hypothetical protein
MDYHGFLEDPETPVGRQSNSHLKTMDELLGLLCLILLGEPGMGKTTTVSQSRAAIEKEIQARGGRVLWLDLHSYKDESRLFRDMFESEDFAAWKSGNGEMHLFLDSYDECLLRIETLSSLIAEELKRLPLDRFRLRIACRGAVWPNSFEVQLKTLWSENEFAAYELAPLRKCDVLEAAVAGDLTDPTAFMKAVDEKQVVPLAIKPITLQFLLNTYRKDGIFPRRQADLYREGCLLLADEVNPERRDSGLMGFLPAPERMAVAGRIAAATVFGGRSAIWTGIDKGDVPREDVKVSSLSGSKVIVDGNSLPVSEPSVRDALTCALFASKEPQRIGWAHQSYAEYLAAWHLVEQRLSKTQLASLLYHSADRRVVPQLYGVAGWLAVLNPDIFDQIVRTDPDLILSADVAGLDESLRASTVGGLLAGIAASIIPFSFDRHWDYKKLAHPGLAAQLRPYLNRRVKSAQVRYEAISIARMCEEKGVQSELTILALDGSEQLDIRVAAAGAVANYADAEVRAALKPLAVGLPDDRDDELKGCALRAVWPSCMATDELFSVLTPPKRGGGFFGVYRTFIVNDLPKKLKVADVLPALRWIEQMLTKEGGEFPLEEIASKVFKLAWNNMDEQGLLESFASAVRLWLERSPYLGVRLEESFVTELTEDDKKRRRLLEAMVPGFTDSGQALMALLFHGPRLLFGRDVPWMCDRLATATDELTKETWAKLLSRLVDPTDVENFGRVIESYRASSALKAALGQAMEPIELGSEYARALEANYREQQSQPQSPDAKDTTPPAQERVNSWLDRFESGQLDAWWQVNYQMLWDTDGRVPIYESESDLTALPGWEGVGPETREPLVRAANRYLRGSDPCTSKWLDTNTPDRPAMAGYRALRLLLSEAPQLCDEIPSDAWRRWAPMILAYQCYTDAEKSAQAALVKKANAHARHELIDTAMVLIDAENRDRSAYPGSLDAMRKCWSADLKAALLTKVRDPVLSPHLVGNILSFLLQHNAREAEDVGASLLTLPIAPTGGDRHIRAVTASVVLLRHARDACWAAVWPAIRDDAEFGREVMEKLMPVSFMMGGESFAQKLTESQLGELYFWLARQYPHSDEPVHDGRARAVGPRFMVCRFRDSVLETIKGKGTPESCAAIKELIRKLPELPWLGQVLLDAQRLTRQQTWRPPTISQIIKLTTDARARLIDDGSQLLDVVMESLERLQEKLLGETPRSRFLWNQSPKRKWRPKEEESLSDYIKGHLDDDIRSRGIVLGREVQIRRHAGEKLGEDTDILVTAVRKNSSGEIYDSVSAIIEVKGCWHKRISTAMKSQLVDRYLKDNQCRHGLYVAVWFDQDSWDEKDARRRQVPKCSPSRARKRLDLQAGKLSRNGLLIRSYLLDATLR